MKATARDRAFRADSKMRQGDFSEFSGAIYDPFSVHTVNGVPTRDPCRAT